MSNNTNLVRINIILREVRKGSFPTKKILEEKIAKENDLLVAEYGSKYKMGSGGRTIERDIDKIMDLYGILIEYDYKERGYYIVNEEPDTIDFIDLIDSFEILQVIRSSKENLPHVFLDNKRAEGFENFNILLKAIKSKKIVHFRHAKYWEDIKKLKAVKPLALKEYKYRWYLIGLDIENNDQVRTYGLDRISEIEPMVKTFTIPKTIKVPNLFDNSFGIIYNEGEPENILLSFTPFQANYIKSLKLHSSQKLVFEDETECHFSLKMHITFDFIQEILSLGSNVKVLKPAYLVYEVKKQLQNNLNQYK